jgi:RHS repeat-associated protein
MQGEVSKTVELLSLEYDKFGKVTDKNLHGGRMNIAYNYDFHGRLIDIDAGELFRQKLAFDKELAETPGNDEKYDGSISSTWWKTYSKEEQYYKFNYDGSGRLAGAISKDGFSDTEYSYNNNGNLDSLKRYDHLGLLNSLRYNYGEGTEEGNRLMKLYRDNTLEYTVWPGDADNDGQAEVDDLLDVTWHMLYNPKAPARHQQGTMWDSVKAYSRPNGYIVDMNLNIYADTDGDGTITLADSMAISLNMPKTHEATEPKETNGFEYEYDDNGNMTFDQFKNIDITYNHLNLPDTIKSRLNGKLVNTYLADGTLIRRQIFDKEGIEKERTDYQGEFLYVNDTLTTIFHDEGFISHKNFGKKPWDIEAGEPLGYEDGFDISQSKHFYQITDHLGHFYQITDEEKNVIQETTYYPYGGINWDLSTKLATNQSLYTGKEFLETFGTNYYDHHARLYDPEVGRWHVIDPQLQFASPYAAMGNSPMMHTDPDGQFMPNDAHRSGRAIYLGPIGTDSLELSGEWIEQQDK